MQNDLRTEAQGETPRRTAPDRNADTGHDGPHVGVFTEVAEGFDAPDVDGAADEPAYDTGATGGFLRGLLQELSGWSVSGRNDGECPGVGADHCLERNRAIEGHETPVLLPGEPHQVDVGQLPVPANQRGIEERRISK